MTKAWTETLSMLSSWHPSFSIRCIIFLPATECRSGQDQTSNCDISAKALSIIEDGLTPILRILQKLLLYVVLKMLCPDGDAKIDGRRPRLQTRDVETL